MDEWADGSGMRDVGRDELVEIRECVDVGMEGREGCICVKVCGEKKGVDKWIVM